MSVDLEALVRQLEADPSRAVALRRVLFGDVPDVSAALERLAGSVADLAAEVRQVAVRQQATEESLRQFADTVRGLVDKVGKHDGWWLEDRHRQKGHAYFQRIARRLHVMTPQALADVVDDAEQAGTLTEREGDLWAGRTPSSPDGCVRAASRCTCSSSRR